MEYADGGDLSKRIADIKKVRGGYMTEEEALNIFVQLCLGLKHMHDRRLLHRDIKSQVRSAVRCGVGAALHGMWVAAAGRLAATPLPYAPLCLRLYLRLLRPRCRTSSCARRAS